MESIIAAAEVGEVDTMAEGIARFPIVIESLHPIHKLQTFALVVVARSKLDAERVLVVGEHDALALVERLL